MKQETVNRKIIIKKSKKASGRDREGGENVMEGGKRIKDEGKNRRGNRARGI